MNKVKDLRWIYGKRKVKDLKPIDLPFISETYYCLEEEIKNKGMHMPILITQGNLIIDGVRRHNILIGLGQGDKEVDVLILTTDLTHGEILDLRASLHANRRHPSPSEVKTTSRKIQKYSINTRDEIEDIVRAAFKAEAFHYRLLRVAMDHIDIRIGNFDWHTRAFAGNISKKSRKRGK